jgi:hypothetical protein
VILGFLTIADRRRRGKSNPEKIAKAIEPLRRILPINARERFIYILVALTAGICEEFLYRGFLLGLLDHGSGLYGSACFSHRLHLVLRKCTRAELVV